MIERVVYIKLGWKRLGTRIDHMLDKRRNDSLQKSPRYDGLSDLLEFSRCLELHYLIEERNVNKDWLVPHDGEQ